MAGTKVKNTGVIAKDSTIKAKIDTTNNEFVDREKEIKYPRLDDAGWKTRMLKIHNKEITLKYMDPSKGTIHSEMDSEEGTVKAYRMEENGMAVDKIQLEEGISVTLKEPVSILETHTGAKEAGKEDDPAGSVYLMSPAGEMTLDFKKIASMKGMKAQGNPGGAKNPVLNLGMFQITGRFNPGETKAYAVEISAFLRDTLKVKQGFKTQMELVQGEYQKKPESDGILKFAHGFTSTQNGKANLPQITQIAFQETQEPGKPPRTTEKKETFYYKIFASTEMYLQKIEENGDTLHAGSAKATYFGFPIEFEELSFHDSKGVMNAKEAKLTIEDKKIKLQNVKMQEKSLQAESGLMQYEGKKVELSEVEIDHNIQAESAVLQIGKGRAKLKEEKNEKVEIAEEITAPAGEMSLYQHQISMMGITLKKGPEVFAASASAEIEHYFTLMTNFRYSGGKAASYDYGRTLAKLNFGKEDKEGKIQTQQQDMMFVMGAGTFDGGFEEGTKSTEFLATKNGNITRIEVEEGTAKEEKQKPDKISQKRRNLLNRLKEKRKNKQKEKKKEKKAPKIYTKSHEQARLQDEIMTLDGYAKVVNATFDFEKEKGETRVVGEGSVQLQDIPMQLFINDKMKKTKTAFAPEEAIEDVQFTIDSSGNLDAVFEDDAEAEFNFKGIMNKENSGEGTVYTVTLGDLSIEKGRLKAGSVTLERGLNIAQGKLKEEEEEGEEKKEEEENPLQMSDAAKKFLECEVSGSIVNEGKDDKVEMTSKGLVAHLGKAHLGKFGVSGFMGFLSGEVDFRSGSIEVSAEKSYEPEKLQESFFSIGAEKKAGIKANILTPIPGVSATFSITPSVGIAGAVGLGVSLGEPFDEWAKKNTAKPIKIEGAVEGEGHAGISVGAGVEFGASYLANVNLELSGELNAEITGNVEGSTAFEYTKDKENGKKLKQSEDFTFDGSLGGKLTALAHVGSSVKFLFWEKQIFKYELFKKELGSLKIKGKGKKSKDKKGFFEGWQLTGFEFDAAWLSQEVHARLGEGTKKGEEDDLISEEEFQSLIMKRKKKAQNAWAVLCKLQEQKKDTVIVLKPEDKKQFDEQIEVAKEDVKNEIDKYQIILNTQKSVLDNNLTEAKKTLTTAKNTAEKNAVQHGLAKDLFEKASWGGFDRKKYVHKEMPKGIEMSEFPDLVYANSTKWNEKSKYRKAEKSYNDAVKNRNARIEEIEKYNKEQDANAAIDLMITYMLGQVSEANLAPAEESFKKLFPKGANYNIKVGFYRDVTGFINTVPEYDHQNNYYNVLKQKAVYRKRVDASTRWDEDKIEGINSYKFQRNKKDFPKEIQNLIEEKPGITMKEILEWILKKGDYTAQQKLELIKKCFVGILPTAIVKKEILGNLVVREHKLSKKHHMIQYGQEVKQGLFDSIGTLFGDIFKSTEAEDGSKLLGEVVKGKKFFDIFEKQQELEQKVAQAKEAVTAAEAKVTEIEADMALIQKEIEENQRKLQLVTTKSTQALNNHHFDASAAKETIQLYSENYVEKMKGNTIKEDLEKRLGKKIDDSKQANIQSLPKSTGKL